MFTYNVYTINTKLFDITRAQLEVDSFCILDHEDGPSESRVTRKWNCDPAILTCFMGVSCKMWIACSA